jgi:hypothetical protein
MSKIPTAVEFVMKGHLYVDSNELKNDLALSHIEFAKLHVEAALESRDRLYEEYYKEQIVFTEGNKDFIKKSYPLENIK